MFSGLGIILTAIILCILWPLTLTYGLYKLSENLKFSAITALIITISVFIANSYYPHILLPAGIVSLLFALGAWMYQEAS
jgi:hypothetical protein